MPGRVGCSAMTRLATCRKCHVVLALTNRFHGSHVDPCSSRAKPLCLALHVGGRNIDFVDGTSASAAGEDKLLMLRYGINLCNRG